MQDYLCIGHCCHDKIGNELVLGGSVSYAAVVAKKLSKTPTIITSVGQDFLFFDYFKNLGIDIINISAEKTTVFENIDIDGHRHQYLHCRANTITPQAIEGFKHFPIIHIGAIADEIDFDILKKFSASLLGINIQGFLRKWDSSGKISAKQLDWSLLQGVNIVFASEDDFLGLEFDPEKITQHVDQLVITHGSKGATIYTLSKKYFVSSIHTKAINTVGAGDVFSTAYLIKYHETNDIIVSCQFAHSAASFLVETGSMDGVPSMEEINQRVKLNYHESI